jgi:gluconate kinase
VLRGEGVVFVLLDGTREELARRLRGRPDHFMPVALLDSQLATLERPGPDEVAVVVDIGAPVDMLVERIVDDLVSIGALSRANLH